MIVAPVESFSQVTLKIICNLRRRDFPPAGKDPAIGWSRVSQNLGDNKKFQLGWVPKYVLSLSKE
jgi:hypothetical protein